MKGIQLSTKKDHAILKKEIIFFSFDQGYGIIIALHKCVYKLELFLRCAIWLMGFMLFIELYCLEADVESMIFLSRFFFIHVVYRFFHFSSFLKLYFTTFSSKVSWGYCF